MTKKKQKRTCDTCGGTGQVSSFKGVSRFLLSTKECAGTGYPLELAEDRGKNAKVSKNNKA